MRQIAHFPYAICLEGKREMFDFNRKSRVEADSLDPPYFL